MVTAKPKGKYTYADYADTPEGERWELIDGVLYHMAAAPIPGTKRFPFFWALLWTPTFCLADWDYCTALPSP